MSSDTLNQFRLVPVHKSFSRRHINATHNVQMFTNKTSCTALDREKQQDLKVTAVRWRSLLGYTHDRDIVNGSCDTSSFIVCAYVADWGRNSWERLLRWRVIGKLFTALSMWTLANIIENGSTTTSAPNTDWRWPKACVMSGWTGSQHFQPWLLIVIEIKTTVHQSSAPVSYYSSINKHISMSNTK